MSILDVMDGDGRAVAIVVDGCSPGTLRQKQWAAHLERHDEAVTVVARLAEASAKFFEAQNNLDNHELMGPNAEDHSVLMRRRNATRRELESALAAYYQLP